MRDFLEELSSENGLPGSGAAGAVALAMAAACAAKAAALTLKHSPERADVHRARETLLAFIQRAMEGSDRDACRFANYLRRRDAGTAERVIAVDAELLSLVEAVEGVVNTLDPKVRPGLLGDLVAARALSHAARVIEEENIAEMRAESAVPT